MKAKWISLSITFLKFLLLWTLLSPFAPWAYALDEQFETYEAPQALAMGKAYTADAFGHQAHFHNPANLSKSPRHKYEVVVADLQGVLGSSGLSLITGEQSVGFYKLLKQTQSRVGDYNYFRFNGLAAFSGRGWGAAFLGAYQYAARSDGTTVDVDNRVDLGPTFGFSRNFAGNLVKLGISGKVFIRNQLKGQFLHSDLNNNDSISSRMKEGMGVGANAGLLFTLPYKYLPTLGVVWKDILNTRFISETSLINSQASGKPDDIEQSVNVALSIHPYFSRTLRGTISVEMSHVEREDLPLRKKLHFGVQLIQHRRLFIWLGMNQLYPTGGFGLRLPGGALEIGTYAQDIGEGETCEADRRFFFRYTISFEP